VYSKWYPVSVGNNSILLTVLDSLVHQARSASLSSDDVMGLSQSQQTLSRSSTLPYDQAPQRAQPQRGGGVRSKTRPGSPGSEMVTLEEFLQESNKKSPPMVRNILIYTISLLLCSYVCSRIITIVGSYMHPSHGYRNIDSKYPLYSRIFTSHPLRQWVTSTSNCILMQTQWKASRLHTSSVESGGFTKLPWVCDVLQRDICAGRVRQ